MNREEEAKLLISFLDKPRVQLCQLVGMEQIGKTSILDKVLAQSAIAPAAIHIVGLLQSVWVAFPYFLRFRGACT